MPVIFEESKEFSFMGDEAPLVKPLENFDKFLEEEPDFGRESVIKHYEPEKKLTSKLIVALLKSAIKKPYKRMVKEGFWALQNYESDPENLSTPRSIYRSYDKPFKADPPAVKYHSRDITVKSEEISQRISSLMERIQSKEFSPQHFSSMETPTSQKSLKLNLYIPRTTLQDSPLSSLSLGGLDTDRASKILTNRSDRLKEELDDMENSEYL